MKLLFCDHCGDVFNLQERLKTCSCGRTKGRYIDNVTAEVNGNGYSLAIGNGSLHFALAASHSMVEDFRQEGDVYRKHPTSIICWARPHEGVVNPHTKINKSLGMEKEKA